MQKKFPLKSLSTLGLILAIYCSMPDAASGMFKTLEDEAKTLRASKPQCVLIGPEDKDHNGWHRWNGGSYYPDKCPECIRFPAVTARLKTVESQMDKLVASELEEATLRKELLQAQIAAFKK